MKSDDDLLIEALREDVELADKTIDLLLDACRKAHTLARQGCYEAQWGPIAEAMKVLSDAIHEVDGDPNGSPN